MTVAIILSKKVPSFLTTTSITAPSFIENVLSKKAETILNNTIATYSNV